MITGMCGKGWVPRELCLVPVFVHGKDLAALAYRDNDRRVRRQGIS